MKIHLFKRNYVALHDIEIEPDLQSKTLYQDAWKRLKKNKVAMVSMAVILLITLIAIFAPFIAPYDPFATDTYNTLASPSTVHLCGTENLHSSIFFRKEAMVSRSLAAQ